MSGRLERLLNRVGPGVRPTPAEVDPVLRDAAEVERDGQLGRRLREFDGDVRELARFGTQPAPSTLPRGMAVPTQRRPSNRQTLAGRRSTPEPMPPKELIARRAALVDGVEGGGVVTLEETRDAQKDVRATMDQGPSVSAEIASTLTTVLETVSRKQNEARRAQSEDQ